MEKDKKEWWKILLFPHWMIKILLVIISAAVMVYAFVFNNMHSIIAYVGYGISAYTLTVVCLKFPVFYRYIRKRLRTNKYSNRYLSEPILRATISLYAGGSINIIYAIFYFGIGVFYRDPWISAIGGYYAILSLIRVGLVRRDRSRLNIEDGFERKLYELKSGHFCGCLMFLLNIAVSVIVGQMVLQNKSYDYPGFMIYAHAAYAFYCLTMAIINFIKYRRMERPILSAAKMISLSCALMSILTTQTAMLMQFGSDTAQFNKLMNILTGIGVCTGVFIIAIWLVHKTRKEMSLLIKEKE